MCPSSIEQEYSMQSSFLYSRSMYSSFSITRVFVAFGYSILECLRFWFEAF